MATVRATIENRQQLQEYQREFFASALTEAENYHVRGWVFGDPYDATLNREFIDLLLQHHIELYELPSVVQIGGETFQPGRSWVVPVRQPMYRLARSIFERTETFADSVFYDASTWTVSLAYGIRDAEVTGNTPALGQRVVEVPTVPMSNIERSSVAYLLDWSDSGTPRALQMLLRSGVRAEVTFAPLTARTHGGNVSLPRGSISVPVGIQDVSADSLYTVVSHAGRESGIRIWSAMTSLSAEGVDLGSRNFRPVRAPRVLIPMGEGVSAYEAGQIWHLLDTRIGMPVTKVDPGDLGRVDLSDYDVIVLVSGNLSMFSGERLELLKSWVRGGGTLITQRTAAAWAARNGFTPNIDPPGVGAPVSAEDDDELTVRRDFADAGANTGAQAIGGSIWEADLDVSHPLGFGYRRRFLPIWRDHSFFFSPSNNAYSTVATLVDDDAHLSGYVSQTNRERLRGSPSVLADRLGGGSVILLIDNTNFRGYWRGTNRLFLNALFFGNHISIP